MTNLQHFFIAGAAKAGTTALYYLLSQHPSVCTSVVKEPNYFSNLSNRRDIVKPGTGPGDGSTVWTETQQEYDGLYQFKEQHRFRLDASVSYLYSTQAARHIWEYRPEAKIILVLRNPVDRAWSHYKHLLRDSREVRSFEKALQLEKKRIGKGWEFSWHLKQMGLYNEQLKRYFNHFESENIRIFLFDDIKNDIAGVVRDTADFLELPAFDFDFEQKRHNASGVSRSRALSGVVNWVVGFKATINKIVPPAATHRMMQLFRSINTKEGNLSLAPETKKELSEYFRDDIQKTSELIGRDLSHWSYE
jgi:hypothetical protein